MAQNETRAQNVRIGKERNMGICETRALKNDFALVSVLSVFVVGKSHEHAATKRTPLSSFRSSGPIAPRDDYFARANS
jgi:hypothetical protein